MWPEMIELLPHVTHIEFLSAICITCGTPDANYSVKLEPPVINTGKEKDQSAAPARQTEDIGGSEKYASVCLSCRDVPIEPEKLKKRKEIVENINKLKHSF
jgi:thymidine kinase